MIIIPANTISGGYEVANSLRFNSASSDYLTRTFGSTTNRRTFTYSFWIKNSDTTTEQNILSAGNFSGEPYMDIRFNTNQTLEWYHYNSGYDWRLITNRVFRDPSAWYHVVLAVDTTQGTSSNRVKLYINGVQETSFSTSSYPSQNFDTVVNNSGYKSSFGSIKNITITYNGYMSEIIQIDGQQLTPTSFGEFDEDTNIWKPIDVSGLTFGTNGFYLDFENSGSLGADVSGNGNNFTVNNLTSIDQSTDTCTNNFATMNPLNVPTSNAPTFAEGNLETESATTSGQRFMGSSTIGLTDGKWYAECKIVVIDSATVGVSPDVQAHALDNTYIGSHQYDYSILPDSGAKYNNDNGTTHGDAFSTNDILMIALDLDNNNVYFGRNGNWFDGSGNANQSSPSSALSLTDPPSTPDGAYFFASSDGGGSAKAKVQWNFGSPPFSISSGNSDGNGYGNFEYAVPSGYYSLNSKNLAEYG